MPQINGFTADAVCGCGVGYDEVGVPFTVEGRLPWRLLATSKGSDALKQTTGAGVSGVVNV